MTSAAVPIRDARGQRTGSEVDPATSPSTAAAGAVLTGVAAWWETRAAAAGLRGAWLDVHWAVDAAAPDLDSITTGADAQVVGTAEQVGQQYVTALSTEERSRHGRHYTPEALAAELWAMTKRALGQKRPGVLPGRVLDPAAGAGALLLPILREHLGAAARVDAQLALKALPNYVSGIDNDPHAAWLASVLLASEMLPVLARTERARRKPLPALVRHGDGLAAVEEPVRVVIMNPPYGRVKLGSTERARFSDALYGHANLYGLFMAAALESLDDQGVLAALVPTSYLAGRYFENLRGILASTAPLREIGFVSDRNGSFTGVLQETSLATFTRKKALRVRINHINGSVSEVAKVATPRISRPWLLPRRADDAAVAAAAIRMPQTLSDVGWRVSTGPLVWNRRRDHLGPRAAAGRLRVLWAADIDGGVVHRDPVRDSTRFLTLSGSDEQVMVLDEPAVLVQRTTAPEQVRRLVSALLDQDVLNQWGGRVVVENHVNVIRPTSTHPAITAEALARLFATDTIDRVLRCLAGSVAVSAYELNSLPLPAVEVLASWNKLTGEAFAHAVASAYTPPAR